MTQGIYRGLLTDDQAAAGMNAAAENARRLIADARLLLKEGRYPSAALLGCLAIEEAGKVSVVRGLATRSTPQALKDGWKDFVRHTKKNNQWILPSLAVGKRVRLADLGILYADGAEHPQELDRFKQLATYVDCVRNGEWSIPEAFVTKELAEYLIATAEFCIPKCPVTSLEMQLWRKHVGGAADDRDSQFSALAAWYADMQAHGLREPGPNEMEVFIKMGIQVGPEAD